MSKNYPLFSDEYFMAQALREAEIAFENDEVPVGAVVVMNNQIIAKAHNQTEKLNDVTAHAEILAITSAANFFSAKYLTDCKIFITLEPCPMCAYALSLSQIPVIIYGALDRKRGFSNLTNNIFSNKIEIRNGILEKDCSIILKDYFRKKREVNIY